MTSTRHAHLVEQLIGPRKGRSAAAPWTERMLLGLGASAVFVDAVLGDLAEERAIREREHGARAAGWWCAREALRSVPHVLGNAVRHGGARGRTRVAVVFTALALVPTVAVTSLLPHSASPARLLFDGQGGGADGIVLNSQHAAQLAMLVFNSRGERLSSTEVHYEWASGMPLPVSPKGVVTCKEFGDATVRAAIGTVETTLLLRCRPVSEVRMLMELPLVAGGRGQDMTLTARGPAGGPVALLAGEFRVMNTTIATMKGLQVRPLAPGQTVVTARVGDGEFHTNLTVYEPVQTLTGLRPDQRFVIAPVRLTNADTIYWPLPQGRVWLRYDPASRGQPIPTFAALGPITCMPDLGRFAGQVACLVRGQGAALRMTHPSTAIPEIVGHLALDRLELH